MLLSYRLGMVLNALVLLCIIVMQGNLVHWVYIVGMISGAMMTFFWMPHGFFTISEINNKRRVIVEVKKQTASAIVKVGVPTALGLFITETNYITTACAILMCCVVQIAMSFMLHPTKDTICQQSKDKLCIASFYKYWKERPLRLTFLYAFCRGWAINGGAATAIMTLLIYNVVKNNTNLGIAESLLSVFLMIIAWLYSKYSKRIGISNIIVWTGLVAFISAIFMLIIPSYITYIAGFIVINSVLGSVYLVFYMAKRYELTSIDKISSCEIVNVNICNEIFLNTGRIMSWICLCIVANLNSTPALLILLLIIVLINGIIGGINLLKLNKLR